MAVRTIPYRTRKDGVKLVLTLDAVVNENGEALDVKGNPIKEEGQTPIPRGFYILQNETGVKYAEAIDVEGAPYTYSETDEKIETEEKIETDEKIETEEETER